MNIEAEVTKAIEDADAAATAVQEQPTEQEPNKPPRITDEMRRLISITVLEVEHGKTKKDATPEEGVLAPGVAVIDSAQFTETLAALCKAWELAEERKGSDAKRMGNLLLMIVFETVVGRRIQRTIPIRYETLRNMSWSRFMAKYMMRSEDCLAEIHALVDEQLRHEQMLGITSFLQPPEK